MNKLLTIAMIAALIAGVTAFRALMVEMNAIGGLPLTLGIALVCYAVGVRLEARQR